MAALPTLLPLRVKATVLPLSGTPPAVRVAETGRRPFSGPEAGATVRLVAATFAKHSETDESAGVTVGSVVVSVAR